MAVKSVTSLVKKFSNEKFGKLGVAGLDKEMKNTMAVLLENQTNFTADLLNENDALDANETTNGNIDYDASQGDRFKPVSLAMVRRAVPTMWTTKWLPTQAIQSPVSLAYALRFYDDKGKTELFKPQSQDSFLGYSGKARKTVSELIGDKSLVLSTGLGDVTATVDTVLVDDGTKKTAFDAIVDTYTQAQKDGVVLSLNASGNFEGSVTATGGEVVKYTIAFDYMAGTTTADAEDWFLAGDKFAPADGGEMRQVGLKLDTVPVYARTRKLGASFSLENAYDLKQMQGLDLHKEMVDTLHAEVASEIDREALWRMKRTAVMGNGGVGKIIQITIPSVASDTSYGRYSAELIDTLVKSITFQANDIYRTTRRATGNFVICSSGLASALQFAPGFTQAKGYSADVNVSRQLEVGKLANGITVYMDADSQETDEWFLVGLKGGGDRDGGIIVSPYMMGVQSEATSPADFSPRVGVMSRLAFTDNLLGAGRYYRYGIVSNFDELQIKH